MCFERITQAMLCKQVEAQEFVQYIENLSHISTCFYSGVEEMQQFKHKNAIWNEFPATGGQENRNEKEIIWSLNFINFKNNF